MIVLAYLLYSNIALMAGMLFALVTQSRRKGEGLANTRLVLRRGFSSASTFRGRSTPEAAQRR